MKKLYIYILLGISIGYSQSDITNSPWLVSASGDNWVQGNYNFCFSLGEIAIDTYIQSDIILTQGFHQETNYLNTEINNVSIHNIQLFPNPTGGLLNIKSDLDESMSLIIQDLQGRVLFSRNNISGNKTQTIDLSKLAQGVYLLELCSESIKKKVYQIQKIN